MSRSLPGRFLIGCALALLAVFAGRVLVEIRRNSATYDEAYFIATGYATLSSGDYRARKDKPLLSQYLVALPLFGSGVAFSADDPMWKAIDPAKATTDEGRDAIWRFGLDFLYHNRIPSGEILLRCRLAPLAAALLLGWTIFRVSRKRYGDWAGLTALAFFTFCPSMIAHAGLATEDMAVTAFFFAAMCSLDRVIECPSAAGGAALGLAAAGAFMSKFTGILLIPLFGVVLAAAGAWRPGWWARYRAPALAAGACAAAFFLAVYRVAHVAEYFHAMSVAREYLRDGHMIFFHGLISTRPFWQYFLVAFLVKTPLPLLAVVVPQFFLPSRYRSRTELSLVAPVLLLLLASSLTPLQIGHRHILPLYPFLFVLAGRAALAAGWRTALVAAVPWAAFESGMIHPHYLSYFNQLVGGPSAGWTCFADSNVDWGQDLNGLRDYLAANGKPEVVLSYYGSGVPEAVGFEYQDLLSFGLWGKNDHLNSAQPQKELLAVSVTNLQGVYLTGLLGPYGLGWLKDREPDAKIGYSIFIFDVTKDAQTHERLGHIYLLNGNARAARREALRALALDPGRPWAGMILAIAADRWDEALRRIEVVARKRFEGIPFEKPIWTPDSLRLYSRSLGLIAAQALDRSAVDLAGSTAELAGRLDPSNAQAFQVLAEALRRKGRGREALRAFEHARQLKRRGPATASGP